MMSNLCLLPLVVLVLIPFLYLANKIVGRDEKWRDDKVGCLAVVFFTIVLVIFMSILMSSPSPR